MRLIRHRERSGDDALRLMVDTVDRKSVFSVETWKVKKRECMVVILTRVMRQCGYFQASLGWKLCFTSSISFTHRVAELESSAM